MKGLTGNIENIDGSNFTHIEEQNLLSPKEEDLHKTVDYPKTKIDVNPVKTVVRINNTVPADIQDLDDQIGSMVELGDHMITVGKEKRTAVICKVCGKEDRKTNIREHIESAHITGMSHPCNICEKISRSRKSLRHHMAKEHHK